MEYRGHMCISLEKYYFLQNWLTYGVTAVWYEEYIGNLHILILFYCFGILKYPSP